jgi:PAS domain S-box-containing protein
MSDVRSPSARPNSSIESVDLDALRPTFRQIVRLAGGLAADCEPDVVLMSKGSRVWRASNDGGWVIRHTDQSLCGATLVANDPVWVQDAAADERFSDHPLVRGPEGLRFYAAAPIRSPAGRAFGVVCISGKSPRSFDATLAQGLADLAAIASNECHRQFTVKKLARSEADARQAQRLSDTLVDNAPVAICMTDRKMRILRANTLWKSEQGLEGSPVGRSLYEAMPSAQAMAEQHTSCLRGEPHTDDKVRMTFHDGSQRWVRSELRPWRDRHGRIGGVLIMTVDVTSLVEAMNETERASERLKVAMKLAECRVWEMDYRRGRLEAETDTQARRMDGAEGPTVGYSELRRDLFSAIHPDDRERVRAEWASAMAEGRTFRSEYRYPSDEKEIWLESASEQIRGEDGRVEQVIGIYKDITARRRAANELTLIKENAERTEERLNLALALANLHVWELDNKRRLLFKAGAEDTFFETSQTYEDLYKDIYVTIDPRDRAGVQEAWRRHVEEGAPYNPEYRIDRSDGREIWVSGAIKFLTDDSGHPVRMVGALQDITERKLAEQELLRAKEQAEAANLAKSTFLATISHEIRTPLNGVLGMAQVMAAEELSPVQRERVGVIQQSGEALLAILHDVLDLSKIEAGKLELEETVFDVGDLARGAHGAFGGVAEQKDLKFDLAIEPDAAGAYRGDSTRVRQILYNLVSNALKFTEHGEVRVNIAAGRPGLTITVKDTGIGVAPDRLDRLFEQFEQADTSTTRRFGGTGLGLAICRDLAHLMGGTIAVESQVDHGTTFTVSLPLAKVVGEPADRQPSPAAANAVADSGAESKLRVLVAEDNEINQLVLRTMLQQAGVEPVVVSNGREAVEAWDAEAWDIVLMDVQMPEMDGIAATRTIRQREAETGRIRTPILALTANAMSHQVKTYAEVGMDGFVAKPIEVSRLFAAIEAALQETGEASPNERASTA